MALQDLTPQLRTRLSRMEQAVGWFVFLATALLLFGFGYYLYHTAERRGWFMVKARFVTYVGSSTGLKIGDAVVMMGFDVGRITDIHALPPGDTRNVKVEFEMREPYFRYIWEQGSVVKVNSADFLGKRQIEVTRGTNGPAICVTQPITVFTNFDDLKQVVTATTNRWQLSQDVFDENSNLLFHAYKMLDEATLQTIEGLKPEAIYAYDNTVSKNRIVAVWHRREHRYENFTAGRDTAWLQAVESPAVTERLEKVVAQVENALPNFLTLTNQIIGLMANGANAASNLNALAVSAHPIVTNADTLIANLDTNITATLTSLSGITSNLNAQVQANSNILGNISKAVTDSDTFVQGLKHHWLLRSAFKHESAAPKKTNAAPVKAK
jgi:ABC-type transporter Mla subunit MlaD